MCDFCLRGHGRQRLPDLQSISGLVLAGRLGHRPQPQLPHDLERQGGRQVPHLLHEVRLPANLSITLLQSKHKILRQPKHHLHPPPRPHPQPQ